MSITEKLFNPQTAINKTTHTIHISSCIFSYFSAMITDFTTTFPKSDMTYYWAVQHGHSCININVYQVLRVTQILE